MTFGGHVGLLRPVGLAMTNEEGIASPALRSRSDEEQKEHPTRPKNNIVKNIHKMYFFTGQAEKYVL